jgi:pSer/pThr/pTyr-binding forkhead associated (FHA) protein
MALYLMPVADGRPVILDKAVIFFGRHPECDVVLNRSRKVSRKHCCVAQVNHRVVLRDLGSMNGVTVNGQRVRKEAPLSVGDELMIGDVVYVLREGKPPAAKPEGTNGYASAAVPPATPRREERPPIEYSQEYPVVIDEDEPDEEA